MNKSDFTRFMMYSEPGKNSEVSENSTTPDTNKEVREDSSQLYFIPELDDRLDDATIQDRIYVTFPHKSTFNPFQENYILKLIQEKYHCLIGQIIEYSGRINGVNSRYLMSNLSSNENILNQEEINKIIQQVQSLAEEVFVETQTPLIKFVRDTCFTNDCLEDVLKIIFGDNYKKYVEIVEINYEKDADNEYLNQVLGGENYLLILGGSESNTYSMNFSHYESPLADIIREIGRDFKVEDKNTFLLAVCFGLQFFGNIISEDNPQSTHLGMTKRGVLHCGLTPYSLKIDQFTQKSYQNMLRGLTNDGKNDSISIISTRASEFVPDIFSGSVPQYLTVLAKDEINGKPGIVGTKNGNVLGIQGHAEFPITVKTHKNHEWLLWLFKELKKQHYVSLDINNMFGNFGFQPYQEKNSYVKREIDLAFYAPVILEFLQKIKSGIDLPEIKYHNNCLDYKKAMGSIRQEVQIRIQGILKEISEQFIPEKSRYETLLNLDKAHKLRLNKIADWKVARGIAEISKLFGVKDFGGLIKELSQIKKEKEKNTFYSVVDLGPGDGTMITQLYHVLSGNDIGVSGFGNYVYLDLFNIIHNDSRLQHIPKSIKVIVVNKILSKINEISDDISVENQIEIGTRELNFSTNDLISYGSMFSNSTKMFSGESLSKLGEHGMNYIMKNQALVEELRISIREKFFSMVTTYVDRIYIGEFDQFNKLTNPLIGLPDFMYAARSTSHLDGPSYMGHIHQTIKYNMKPGAIYFDNGVHESYTSIPRIFELHRVMQLHDPKEVKIQLLFDTRTNYFTSAVIQKAPFIGNEFIEKQSSENIKIIDIEDAQKTTFFKLEYFIRTLIIINFKSKKVFWDFNNKLIKFINNMILDISQGVEVEIIITNITNFINDDIIKKMNKIYYEKGGIVIYKENENIIGMETDYKYISKFSIDTHKMSDGRTLREFIKDFYHPDWINPNGKRYY